MDHSVIDVAHHPEIEYGIMPGVALALVDSMRRAAG